MGIERQGGGGLEASTTAGLATEKKRLSVTRRGGAGRVGKGVSEGAGPGLDVVLSIEDEEVEKGNMDVEELRVLGARKGCRRAGRAGKGGDGKRRGMMGGCEFLCVGGERGKRATNLAVGAGRAGRAGRASATGSTCLAVDPVEAVHTMHAVHSRHAWHSWRSRGPVRTVGPGGACHAPNVIRLVPQRLTPSTHSGSRPLRTIGTKIELKGIMIPLTTLMPSSPTPPSLVHTHARIHARTNS